ncbi:Aldo/keto reductase [Schizophyllum commune H4-8]|uniref:NADP-dependent oxidoreductase domain-containing protein n=1 Tax=Schizophyllum commune (strain H4-8 / FGSC 9210) TaxID=578458 RepID=D8Q5I5_SCHCM|nr:Aldo/keto reductase [Schizophyllum commune H4-8]KAI5892168.1 Aldo/keto reductase [Schizophyllum commune H4-8]
MAASYPKRHLGRNGPLVSAIGFGAMGRLSGFDFYGVTNEEEVFATLSRAADLGVTFWDTSDFYGDSTHLMFTFSLTSRRDEIFLATKFGCCDFSPSATEFFKPNSKPDYVRERVETALKRLQTDRIDLFYQHRVDPEVPIEVVLETLRPYVEKGTVKYIGLSECSANVLRRARGVAGIGEKVIAAQMELSPFELFIVQNGFLDAARELGVGIVAYSPLGRGMITGKYRSLDDFEPGDMRRAMPRFQEENFAKNLVLVDAFKTIADKYKATSAQICLAWLLAAYPDSIPIPGSRNPTRLEENAKAAHIQLTADDLATLTDLVKKAEVSGGRYPSAHDPSNFADCITLAEWEARR